MLRLALVACPVALSPGGARTAPHPLASKNFQNTIQKKFAIRFQKLRCPATCGTDGAGGALRRSRRLARAAEKAPYVKYIQGDVHSIYKVKLGVRHARAAPLPTLTS